ncbi:MAG: ribonuclease PH [Chloroflexi bacterium]|nr:ribonuclease PH [Chloroflexota bacterium]MYF23358.1 ribonuclease PH [Chloroflexota bacterium]
MVRIDGRQPNELRPLSFELDVQRHADGSCVVSLGDTSVLCAVTVEEQVPRWMRGTGSGWLTAEYSMLPAATNTRSNRERVLSAGRTKEIQRLIGRSLRAAVNLGALGERTFNIDCDVLNADGGTRTAAITGAFVAVSRAINTLAYDRSPIVSAVAAVSVGIIDGEILVDLNYEEDSSADVDCNIVGLASGGLVEVQGTAEGETFTPEQLSQMVAEAQLELKKMFAAQHAAIDQK